MSYKNDVYVMPEEIGVPNELADELGIKTPLAMFRDLDDAEETEFRKAARQNYKAGEDISQLWHPVYRDECELINMEN